MIIFWDTKIVFFVLQKNPKKHPKIILPNEPQLKQNIQKFKIGPERILRIWMTRIWSKRRNFVIFGEFSDSLVYTHILIS